MVRRKIKKKRLGGIAAPWLAHLRAVTQIQVALGCARRPVVLVYVVPRLCGDAWRESVDKVREAMELLGMIATVDHSAWVAIFRHDFGYNERPLPPSFKKGGCPPEFWLSFTNQEIPSRAEDMLVDDTPYYRHFFLSASTEAGYARSEDLLRARDDIWRNITPSMRHQLSRAKPFAVDVKFRGPQQQDDALAQTYLENVLDIVRAGMSLGGSVGSQIVAPDTTQGLRAGCPFVFQNIELDLSEASLLPPSTLPVLAELGASGVQLGPAVDFGQTAAYGRFSVAELGPLLLALTNSSGGGGLHRAQKNRSEAMTQRLDTSSRTLRCGYRSGHAPDIDNYKCEAVFSAMTTCRDAEKLQLRNMFLAGPSQSRARKWQWLAYCLFSNESKSTISSLTIDDDVFMEIDMDAINSVLGARNPARQLLSRNVPLTHAEQDAENEGTADAQADAEDALEYVSLKAGATITINPLDRSIEGDPATFELECDSTFRVIGKLDSRNQWDILVPAYGHCSVPRGPDTELLPTVEAPAESSLTEGYRGTITTLEMKFMIVNDGHALVPLLTYLAPRLEHLELYSVILRRVSLRAILNECRQLKSLVLPFTRNGIERELMAAYDEMDCQIESLAITNLVPSPDTTEFILRLQDPNRAMTKRLQNLTLLVPPTSRLERSTLTALLDMLAANQTIEQFTLVTAGAIPFLVTHQFYKFDGQLLPTSGRPLSPRCRLAFVSVVDRLSTSFCGDRDGEERPKKRRRGPWSTDIGRLDRGVLALVFQFAAERARREVKISNEF